MLASHDQSSNADNLKKVDFVTQPTESSRTVELSIPAEVNMNLKCLRAFDGKINISDDNTFTIDDTMTMQGEFVANKKSGGNAPTIEFQGVAEKTVTFNRNVDMSKATATFSGSKFVFRGELTV